MESLNETEWDVLIDGTGLHQSLLALALSRSGKKVLHIDKNGYYGGSEAALSLQEAEEWANTTDSTEFNQASITQPQRTDADGPKLAFSRAYSLALAPQLIYTQSTLLRFLVSSKVYRQLEFLAMGSWWVYTPTNSSQTASVEGPKQNTEGRLLRIPTNREDVAFGGDSFDLRSKRAVMKVLRFVSEFERQPEIWESYQQKPFADFLSEQFKLPAGLIDLFQALTLTSDPPSRATTAFALPRIARHLRSIGRLGPGFSSLIPKWGGLSEVVQVACRAGAVGGGTYVLGTGISELSAGNNTGTESSVAADGDIPDVVKVQLTNGDSVRTKVVVRSSETTLVSDKDGNSDGSPSSSTTSRSITIVSSTLQSLYPITTEGTPPPAGSVVVFPSSYFGPDESDNKTAQVPPVYLVIHSAATGECPIGQSVIYASTSQPAPNGIKTLDAVVNTLLRTVDEPTTPQILWSTQYQQRSHGTHEHHGNEASSTAGTIFEFPSLSVDMLFDETVFERVAPVWKKIMGSEADGLNFLIFPDREGEAEEDDDDG